MNVGNLLFLVTIFFYLSLYKSTPFPIGFKSSIDFRIRGGKRSIKPNLYHVLNQRNNLKVLP